MTPLPVVVLISGRGSNLKAIIDETRAGRLPIRIVGVVSNRTDAGGLGLARAAGIDALVLEHRRFPDRAGFDHALMTAIDAYRPGLVVLAGFMRILGSAFIEHYRGRMLNIHPSLLPAFPGLDTHARALAAGRAEHGASVHFVTEEVDGGPVVLQARVDVRADDTPESLAARVLREEHRIYPQAIRWFAEGRLKLEAGRAYLDGAPL